jgi:hypothetical protein
MDPPATPQHRGVRLARDKGGNLYLAQSLDDPILHDLPDAPVIKVP